MRTVSLSGGAGDDPRATPDGGQQSADPPVDAPVRLPCGMELRMLLRWLIEVTDGRLAPDRVRLRVAPTLAAALVIQARLATANPAPPRTLERYSLAMPRKGVMEIWGTVRSATQNRLQALAARIEGNTMGWRCTEFTLLA